MNIKEIRPVLLLILFMMTGCEKFLEVKNFSKDIIPARVSDLEAIIDNHVSVTGGTAISNMFSDNHLITSQAFSALRNDDYRDEYLMNVKPENIEIRSVWNNSYESIFYANAVLDGLSFVKDGNSLSGRQLKGHALFMRALVHFNLLETFSLPYKRETSGKNLGIPIKKSPDINEKIFRSTIEECYTHILGDLKEALELVPDKKQLLNRADKPSVNALLARIHLVRGEYEKAGFYANEVLKMNSYVDDYNLRDMNASFPFNYQMKEIIQFYIAGGAYFIDVRKSYIDPDLYNLYDENDLRKTGFFMGSLPANITFRGSYLGNVSRTFRGITVPEVLLIRAECFARDGKLQQAMDDLNNLLKNRYNTGDFQPLTAINENDALNKIINERRKELLMRGQRASDLRRLREDPRFAKTITRTVLVNGETIKGTLPPMSPKYALPIPQNVINLSGIPQNDLD